VVKNKAHFKEVKLPFYLLYRTLATVAWKAKEEEEEATVASCIRSL
jgi:hypothetical protein